MTIGSDAVDGHDDAGERGFLIEICNDQCN